MERTTHETPGNKNANQLAKEVAEAVPKIDWATYIPDKQYGVVISLPHGCSITGTLTYRENGDADVYVDIFQINEQLQGRGIGTRLMETLIEEALNYDAKTISGHFTSKPALKTMAKIFGPENLFFHNPRTKEPIKITYEKVSEQERTDIIVSSHLTTFRKEIS